MDASDSRSARLSKLANAMYAYSRGVSCPVVNRYIKDPKANNEEFIKDVNSREPKAISSQSMRSFLSSISEQDKKVLRKVYPLIVGFENPLAKLHTNSLFSKREGALESQDLIRVDHDQESIVSQGLAPKPEFQVVKDPEPELPPQVDLHPAQILQPQTQEQVDLSPDVDLKKQAMSVALDVEVVERPEIVHQTIPQAFAVLQEAVPALAMPVIKAPKSVARKPGLNLVSLERRETVNLRAAEIERLIPVVHNDSVLHHLVRNVAQNPLLHDRIEDLFFDRVIKAMRSGISEEIARRQVAGEIAMVGVANDQGDTPLHLALKNKDARSITFLLDNVVSLLDERKKSNFLNRENSAGDSILDIASRDPMTLDIFASRDLDLIPQESSKDFKQWAWQEEKARQDVASYGVGDSSHIAKKGENLALKLFEKYKKEATKPEIDYSKMTDPVKRAREEMWGSGADSAKAPNSAVGSPKATQVARNSRGFGIAAN